MMLYTNIRIYANIRRQSFSIFKRLLNQGVLKFRCEQHYPVQCISALLSAVLGQHQWRRCDAIVLHYYVFKQHIISFHFPAVWTKAFMPLSRRCRNA